MRPPLTDPAAEIGDLFAWLGEIAPRPAQTFHAICEALGLKVDSGDYIELVAAALSRVDRLTKLIEELKGEGLLPEHLCGEAADACSRLRGVFTAPGQSSRWDGIKEKNLRPQHLYTLYKISTELRPLRPLRQLTDQDREEVVRKIDEAASTIRGCGDLDFVVRDHLAQSLDRLQLIFKHFRFFGHAAALNQIATLQRSVEVAKPAARSVRARAALSAAVIVILAAGDLFALPHNVQEAYPFWEKLVKSFHPAKLLSGPDVTAPPDDGPPKPHLPLPAPVATLPSEAPPSPSKDKGRGGTKGKRPRKLRGAPPADT